jgi:hypothetical protein
MAFEPGKYLDFSGEILTSNSEYFKSEEPLGMERLRLPRAGKARRHFPFPTLWRGF